MKANDLRYTRYTKERYLTAFLLGALTLLLALLPVMLCERGYFIYYGDFNAQQIPFYSLSNDAVRAGQLGWNWFTDLGSDWLTSYSFYLAASPFFWLTTILPRAAVPYSIPFRAQARSRIADRICLYPPFCPQQGGFPRRGYALCILGISGFQPLLQPLSGRNCALPAHAHRSRGEHQQPQTRLVRGNCGGDGGAQLLLLRG